MAVDVITELSKPGSRNGCVKKQHLIHKYGLNFQNLSLKFYQTSTQKIGEDKGILSKTVDICRTLNLSRIGMLLMCTWAIHEERQYMAHEAFWFKIVYIIRVLCDKGIKGAVDYICIFQMFQQ